MGFNTSGVLFYPFFCVLDTPPAHSRVERLRVVLDWDYPPFTSINEKGALVGISVDFWKRFEEKTGVQVALVPMEWNMAHQVMLRK
ncbi:MAG: transporter substrate-binding domain-containing protein, partial [Limisphaerales bacterium]